MAPNNRPNDLQRALISIQNECQRRTGELHLSNLNIKKLPDEISSLSWLKSLTINNSGLVSLAGIESLTQLEVLSCKNSSIKDLNGIQHLHNLWWVDVSNTQIDNLEYLSKLKNLKKVFACGLKLNSIPHKLLSGQFIEHFNYFGSKIDGIPEEVMQVSHTDNRHDKLIAYLRDMDGGSVSFDQMKLVVLGNGGVGKTQLCRHFDKSAFDATWNSTHGIVVRECSIDNVPFSVWDFGGQEIYHGTHALFMKTRAILLICWDSLTEMADWQDDGHFQHRLYPLQYWLQYVTALSAAASPIIIIQTKCDSAEQVDNISGTIINTLAGHRFARSISFSSKSKFGQSELHKTLASARENLLQASGKAKIGKGRMAVIRTLLDRRAADAQIDKHEERKDRLILRPDFDRLCNEIQNISSTELLLEFLHDIGVVFYNKDPFKGNIILDQEWAIDAIYSVFDRQKSAPYLRDNLYGRFDREILELLVWRDKAPDEHELLISMMEACKICFRVFDEPGKRTYIAPDLLPRKDTISHRLPERWDEEAPFDNVRIAFELMHEGLIRSILTQIGSNAQMSALYWRGGLCVYEKTTKSRAIIEQEKAEGWSGFIDLKTQSGQSAVLMNYLQRLVLNEASRCGLAGEIATDTRTIRPEKTVIKPEFVRESGDYQETHYLSYAWGDATEAGIKRDQAANDICEYARKKGIQIIRDKDVITDFGASIKNFMKNLTRGSNIYIVISDKYLMSENCCYEICMIWEKCQNDGQDFFKKAHIYNADGVNIFDVSIRAKYERHWQKKYKDVVSGNKLLPHDLMYNPRYIEQRNTTMIYQHLPAILYEISKTIQPRTFPEFITHAFGE